MLKNISLRCFLFVSFNFAKLVVFYSAPDHVFLRRRGQDPPVRDGRGRGGANGVGDGGERR